METNCRLARRHAPRPWSLALHRRTPGLAPVSPVSVSMIRLHALSPSCSPVFPSSRFLFFRVVVPFRFRAFVPPFPIALCLDSFRFSHRIPASSARLGLGDAPQPWQQTPTQTEVGVPLQAPLHAPGIRRLSVVVWLTLPAVFPSCTPGDSNVHIHHHTHHPPLTTPPTPT